MAVRQVEAGLLEEDTMKRTLGQVKDALRFLKSVADTELSKADTSMGRQFLLGRLGAYATAVSLLNDVVETEATT